MANPISNTGDIVASGKIEMRAEISITEEKK
jgi:hypothetical protein